MPRLSKKEFRFFRKSFSTSFPWLAGLGMRWVSRMDRRLSFQIAKQGYPHRAVGREKQIGGLSGTVVIRCMGIWRERGRIEGKLRSQRELSVQPGDGPPCRSKIVLVRILICSES